MKKITISLFAALFLGSATGYASYGYLGKVHTNAVSSSNSKAGLGNQTPRSCYEILVHRFTPPQQNSPLPNNSNTHLEESARQNEIKSNLETITQGMLSKFHARAHSDAPNRKLSVKLLYRSSKVLQRLNGNKEPTFFSDIIDMLAPLKIEEESEPSSAEQKTKFSDAKNKVETMIRFYRNYAQDLKLEILRLVTLAQKYQVIEKAGQEGRYPVTVKVPVIKGQSSVVFQDILLEDQEDQKLDLESTLRGEEANFSKSGLLNPDGNYNFLSAREYRQAVLRAQLEVALSIINSQANASDALGELVKQIKTALRDPAFKPSTRAQINLEIDKLVSEYMFATGNSNIKTSTAATANVPMASPPSQSGSGATKYLFKRYALPIALSSIALLSPTAYESYVIPFANDIRDRLRPEAAIERVVKAPTDEEYLKGLEQLLKRKFGENYSKQGAMNPEVDAFLAKVYQLRMADSEKNRNALVELEKKLKNASGYNRTSQK